jgi:hypothetical protein
MTCAHQKIEAALDRWQERHWHLHQLEGHYHDADVLRYSMNAFIRALREIPDMVNMSTQNNKEFVAWHKPVRKALETEDPLIVQIIKHRRYIVHKSMLKPESKAYMAAIRGYTIKMQFRFYVDPFEDSDSAVNRFLEMTKENPVLLGMLAPDDVQVLALIREWHIEGFDKEIITVFRHAWLRIGAYLSDIIEFLGGERFPDTLPSCFKDPREHYYKKYHGLFSEAQ